MELQHDGASDGTTAPDIATPPTEPAALIGPDLTTASLRRCTALATRARADLLVHGRHGASAELAGLLEEMARWEPAALVDPDPTMTVLAAAALQDLAARLPDAAPTDLPARIDTVVALLRGVMDRGSVRASA